MHRDCEIWFALWAEIAWRPRACSARKSVQLGTMQLTTLQFRRTGQLLPMWRGNASLNTTCKPSRSWCKWRQPTAPKGCHLCARTVRIDRHYSHRAAGNRAAACCPSSGTSRQQANGDLSSPFISPAWGTVRSAWCTAALQTTTTLMAKCCRWQAPLMHRTGASMGRGWRGVGAAIACARAAAKRLNRCQFCRLCKPFRSAP